uniref:Transcription activation suppressor b n=1 Tax=Poecilia reticulata TaxID=8081 RepID=A0A3P9PVE2_POERE
MFFFVLFTSNAGVYLSKYSDLLQINPLEVGSFGDMIILKVMRGRIKHIHENMPKNAIELSPKFDCHLSKSANRVTSLLSYRAFELTQQYFFEFAFDEIKPRPRHVCPYAVVSFQYKGKEVAASPMAAHRYVILQEMVTCYTVWSGPLVNKGQELFPVCLRSFSRPYLPFKLREKLEMNQGMQLDQVKRKIPPFLFSWDTYSISREVMKCGMSCSLFEVAEGKGKATSGSLAALINKLERDRMVRSFKKAAVCFPERRGRMEKKLQALFIFQESRMVVKLSEPEPLTVEPQPAFLSTMEPFIPALHYALFKLRPNPGKELSLGVERQATDYLTRIESGTVRPFILPDYKNSFDERASPLSVPRPKFNMDAVLRSYVHNSANYFLPLGKARDTIERIKNPAPYSPVSDWGGSDRVPPESAKRRQDVTHSNGAQLQPNEYDHDKMKQLLKLIQLHKKNLVQEPGKDQEKDGSWDANNLKRKFEGDAGGGMNKHQRTDHLSNGEPSRDNLTAVMESMGIYDTDLRNRGSTDAASTNETQRLLKILLATLNKAMAQSSMTVLANHGESSSTSGTMESILSDSPEAAPPAETSQEPKTPAGLEVKSSAAALVGDEVPFLPSISLDTILNQEIHSLASDIRDLMQTRRISYASQIPSRLSLRHCWQPSSCFSDYVVPHVLPVSVEGHVEALCEKMDKLIPAPPASPKVTAPPPPVTTSSLTTPAPTAVQASKAKAELPASKADGSKTSCVSNETTSVKAKTEASSPDLGGGLYSPSHTTADSPESNAQSAGVAPDGGSTLLSGSLIGQLKPEVFTSLVEIFKDVTKNTVKFYIYSGEEGEDGTICKEIKEYLKSLGNSECSPQTFLENSGSLDKLLIIIRNEDIAAHVHKIPALVSLKKLPSVSFAGVDSLDDVKNHTYNELFVSGGFMVSDEFVLNPDLITQDRLQGLLKFLEEQSTPEHPWQWKVHCKSQKKLKELGRLNANAMGLLNLLTTYQKKHLVEFLPYHECDTQSRQAPDLECLIKLQAQHTQQRHLIFLTDSSFPHLFSFLHGFMFLPLSLPSPVLPVVNDECVEAEDMSLDSDDGEPPTMSDPLEQVEAKNKPELLPQLEKEDFRPPLPDLPTTPDRTSALESSSLKTAISQFKATNQIGLACSDIGSLSPGGFPVNTHQSFLCPSASWSSYSGSSSYVASPAYPASPCSSTQEQEYRPPSTTAPALPTPPVMAMVGPLANLASLPLEVKPPPPPPFMMQGQPYGSDAGGAISAGASLLVSALPYKDHSDTAQPGYLGAIPKNAGGTPTQHDRILSGSGESIWGSTGTSACETACSQGAITSRSADPSGVPKTGEIPVGSTPGAQGCRTQGNGAEGLGTPVGILPVATRGGSVPRPKLPPHPVGGLGYGSIGGIPGHMDHGPMRGALVPGHLGGFRGRGVPPVGIWPRAGRGQELGDGSGTGPCPWVYPSGRGGPQNYYTDYTYTHNYAPE